MKTKKMKLSLISLVGLVVLLMPAFFVSAQDTGGYWNSDSIDLDTNCFDYYKFSSVQVSMGADKSVARPGETVEFRGNITNQNEYPIVDGYVFVRIGRRNDNYIKEGNFIVDEFFALENTNLGSKESKEAKFDWTVPENLTKGDYRADFFFSVGKKFNLNGLPFSNEIVGGFANFSVDSGNSSYISFNRTETKINGDKYYHIGVWPRIESGQNASISQPIQNVYAEDKEVSVTYDLYYWDSLNEEDKLDSRTEKVMIPADSSVVLSYEIPRVSETVYYLKITASSEKDKSMVNIRISSNNERPRINYPAITKFPIQKGESFTLFSCFHNTSSMSTRGDVIVSLFNRKGNEIGTLSYSGEIPSLMSADKIDITAKEDIDYVKLSAKVENKDGKIVDEYESVYDCNYFENCLTPESKEAAVDRNGSAGISGKMKMLLIGIAFFIIVLVIIIVMKIMRKSKFPTTTTMTLLLVAIISLTFMFSNDAKAVDGRSVTTPSKNYSFRLGTCEGGGCGGNSNTCRGGTPFSFDGAPAYYKLAEQGNVRVTHSLDVNRPLGVANPVSSGDAINFTYDATLEYFSTGGDFDTPFGSLCNSIDDACFTTCRDAGCRGNSSCQRFRGTSCGDMTNATGGYGFGWEYWTGERPKTATAANPTDPNRVRVISSDDSVVSCSGVNCTATGPGTTTLTGYFPETKTRYWLWRETGDAAWLTDGGYYYAYLVPDDNIYSRCVAPNAIYRGNDRMTVSAPLTPVSWDVEVVAPAINRVLSCNTTSDFTAGNYNVTIDPLAPAGATATYEIWGAGGGGGGDAGSISGLVATPGGNGGNSSVASLSANGGTGGSVTGIDAPGGTASGGTVNIPGGTGQARPSCYTGGNGGFGGGPGGGSGGAGNTTIADGGGDGNVPGGGGGGGLYDATACAGSGGGGGGYSYLEDSIVTAGSVIPLVVGVGGSKGIGYIHPSFPGVNVSGYGGLGGDGFARITLECTPPCATDFQYHCVEYAPACGTNNFCSATGVAYCEYRDDNNCPTSVTQSFSRDVCVSNGVSCAEPLTIQCPCSDNNYREVEP